MKKNEIQTKRMHWSEWLMKLSYNTLLWVGDSTILKDKKK